MTLERIISRHAIEPKDYVKVKCVVQRNIKDKGSEINIETNQYKKRRSIS